MMRMDASALAVCLQPNVGQVLHDLLVYDPWDHVSGPHSAAPTTVAPPSLLTERLHEPQP